MATTNLEQIKKGDIAPSPRKALSNLLQRQMSQISAALPKHLNADRMVRLALTSFSQNAALQKCSPESIVSSLMIAAQMGLEIGVSGQGYLVPYKGKATFVPGWQGIVDIVNRAGRATVWTGAVFEGDVFDYGLGDSPFVKHKPAGESDPAKLTHVYAIGRVNGAQHPVIDVWPIAKARKHLSKMNKVGAAHYANSNFEMYARKLPLLQVTKYMPKSIELAVAVAQAHAAEEGRTIEVDANWNPINLPEPPADAPIDAETGEILGADTPAEGQDEPATPSAPAQAGKTYAVFADEILNATDAETASLSLDEARSTLSPALVDELGAVYSTKWSTK